MTTGTRTLLSAGAPFEKLHVEAAELLLVARKDAKPKEVQQRALGGLCVAVHLVSKEKLKTGRQDLSSEGTSSLYLCNLYEAISGARKNLVAAGELPEGLLPSSSEQIELEKSRALDLTSPSRQKVHRQIKRSPAQYGMQVVDFGSRDFTIPYIDAYEDTTFENRAIATAILATNVHKLNE